MESDEVCESESCGNCVYSLKDGPFTSCRRWPFQLIVVNNEVRTVRPTVSPDNWCGEWAGGESYEDE